MQSIRVAKTPAELPERLKNVLPGYLTDAVRRCGAPCAEEIRIHRDRYTTVSCMGRNYVTDIIFNASEIQEILQKLCGGSLYAFSQTINRGYISPGDGIRVGICGSAATENGTIIGVSEISGLIIRIPHRQTVSAKPILEQLRALGGLGGILIYAPPGVGKTTLLRAIAIEASSGENALRTVVVDSGEELGYILEGKTLSLDVLEGYPKRIGIEIAVQKLGAQLIICDEVGSPQDAHAILSAANCGVPLIASAHAANPQELLRRPSFQLLHRAQVFGVYAGIRRDGCGGFFYRFTSRQDADITDICEHRRK